MMFAKGLILTHDARDKNHVYAATGAGWRFSSRFHHIPELLCQGTAPTCVGYSSHLIARMPPMPFEQPDIPSPESIYATSRKLDNVTSQEGSSIRGGMKALQGAGVITSYTWIEGVQDLIEAVRDVGPVLAGTQWTERMQFPDDRGYVTPGSDEGSGHAYVISGVDKTRGFLIPNSWGYGWGDYGRCWMTARTLETLFERGGVFALPIKTGYEKP